MDNAHSHHADSPNTTNVNHGSTQGIGGTLPRLAPTTSLLPLEPPPPRQQRLLEGRNARFPAKKLSISGLSNRLNQLIHANIEIEGDSKKSKENEVQKRRSTSNTGKTASNYQPLNILEEISNSTEHRSLRRRRSIPIYHDNQERPLLEPSPFGSPVVYGEDTSVTQSPVDVGYIQNSSREMRLREISGNARKSPLAGLHKRKRSSLLSQSVPPFDAEDYIEHIEKELQQARNDAYSPRTRRPLKDKLKSAICENERLQKELTQLRDQFEAELKRSVENNTSAEVALHRKVRDLENRLDEKNIIIQELQHQREDKRLDSNTIETLKATIDRLEQEKQTMEDEHLNVTKRNDILTQLLAMSPTKSHPVELVSPTQEKKPIRPLSLVLPRPPSSPSTKLTSCAVSAAASPMVDHAHHPTTLQASAQRKHEMMVAILPSSDEYLVNSTHVSKYDSPVSPRGSQHHVRHSTMQSETSPISSKSFPMQRSPSEGNKDHYRRKPRKFLRGSTQLKPLLLPTLNSDFTAPSSPPLASSPRQILDRLPLQYSSQSPSSIVHHAEEMAQDDSSFELDHDLGDTGCLRASVSEGPGPVLLDMDREMFQTDQGNLAFGLYPRSSFVELIDGCSDTKNFTLNRLANAQADSPSIDRSRTYQDTLQSRRLGLIDAGESHVRPWSRLEMRKNTVDAEIPPPLFSPDLSPDPNFSFLVQQNSAETSVTRKRPKPCSAYNASCKSPTPKIVCRRQSRHSSQYLAVDTDNPSLSNQSINHVRRSSYPQLQVQRIGLSKSPIDLLKNRKLSPGPISLLGIRTAYGVLSTCTNYVRELKRDPFALAKRVLANAWHRNWAAMGNMSWWVLGLFLGRGYQHVRRRDIDWGKYDGEFIANQACWPDTEDSDAIPTSPLLDQRSSHQPQYWSKMKCPDPQSTIPQPAEKPERSRWGSSLLLWGKFSMALMLAVGGAVIHGPAEMLKDLDTSKRKSLQNVGEHRATSRDCPNHSCGEHRSPQFRPTFERTNTRRTGSGFTGSGAMDFPLFTFKSGLQLEPLPLNAANSSPDENCTIRPCHSLRPGLGNAFSVQGHDPPLILDEGSIEGSPCSNASEHTSLFDGFLQWPPSPDSLSANWQ